MVAGGWPSSAGGGRAGGARHDPGGHRGGRGGEQHTARGAGAGGPARSWSHGGMSLRWLAWV